ncbi:MAG: matrixin family metalloprotease, partial [bacterium]
MKKVLLVALAVSLAAPALAFLVGTYQGRPCYHTANQMPWTMRFNSRGTPDCTGELPQLLRALNTWGNVTGQWFRHARGTNTSTLNRGLDGINLEVWYEPAYRAYGQGSWPYSSGAVAVNMYWMQSMGTFWRVIENDITFNGYDYTWSATGQSGRMDVQNINAHETGHNLVLADLYDSASREFTMYGYVANGETKKRTLHQDDINGIRYIYGYQRIKLESFTATARKSRVLVAWKVSREENHAGYNLYRLEDVGAGADYVKLNEALIVGRSPYEFEDGGVKAGTAYKYLLESVDLSGGKERFGPARVEVPTAQKRVFALAQSYPNPARTAATIKFALPEATTAELEVYDLSGRRVA